MQRDFFLCLSVVHVTFRRIHSRLYMHVIMLIGTVPAGLKPADIVNNCTVNSTTGSQYLRQSSHIRLRSCHRAMYVVRLFHLALTWTMEQVAKPADMNTCATGEAITCNYVTMFVVLVSAGLKPADVHMICIFQRECFSCAANN